MSNRRTPFEISLGCWFFGVLCRAVVACALALCAPCGAGCASGCAFPARSVCHILESAAEHMGSSPRNFPRPSPFSPPSAFLAFVLPLGGAAKKGLGARRCAPSSPCARLLARLRRAHNYVMQFVHALRAFNPPLSKTGV